MENREIITFVDDDKIILHRVKKQLSSFNNQWDLKYYTSATDALSDLEFNNCTLIVSDWMMPEMDGLHFLHEIRKLEKLENRGKIYFLLLSGMEETDFIVQGLDAGADDYICKPFDIRELEARIKVGLRLTCFDREMRSTNKRLEFLATIDPLTSLYNRRKGLDFLNKEMSKVGRGIEDFSIVMLDIDHFKEVNDVFGHDAGDTVLKELASRIQISCRDYDMIVRWGGEEILIICPFTTDQEIQIVAERIRNSIANVPFLLNDHNPVSITASLGTASIEKNTPLDINSFLNQADKALYHAKQNGRNQTSSFTETKN